MASKEFVVLENRVAAMEMERKNQLSAQQEKEKELETIRNKVNDGISPEDYAELKYEVKQLREKSQQLEGMIDEVKYNLGIYNQKDNSGFENRIQRLDNAVTHNYERLVELEKYLGLEPSSQAAVPAQPQTVQAQPGDKVQVPQPATATTVPSSGGSGELDQYAAAKKLLDDGEREKARAAFENFIKQYPDSDNADNARFWIADSYYSDKWFEKAILEYQKVIEDYPSSNKIAAARLKQGYAFAELGEKANARLILNEVIKKHPDSAEAKTAREKLKTLQ